MGLVQLRPLDRGHRAGPREYTAPFSWAHDHRQDLLHLRPCGICFFRGRDMHSLCSDERRARWFAESAAEEPKSSDRGLVLSNFTSQP